MRACKALGNRAQMNDEEMHCSCTFHLMQIPLLLLQRFKAKRTHVSLSSLQTAIHTGFIISFVSFVSGWRASRRGSSSHHSPARKLVSLQHQGRRGHCSCHHCCHRPFVKSGTAAVQYPRLLAQNPAARDKGNSLTPKR